MRDNNTPVTPPVKGKITPPPIKYEVYRVGEGALHVIAVDGGTVVEAPNDIRAITLALGETPQPGKYVAIPLRSLRVRDVGTEVKTKVVIK